MKETGQVNLEE